MLAPKAPSSWLTLSPTSSAMVETAVATVIPSATATRLSSLRLRRRTRDRPMIRLNIEPNCQESAGHQPAIRRSASRSLTPLTLEHLGGAGQRVLREDHGAVLHPVVDVDRIAPTRRADGRGIHCRTAVPANHVVAVLAITLSAADHAGVE